MHEPRCDAGDGTGGVPAGRHHAGVLITFEYLKPELLPWPAGVVGGHRGAYLACVARGAADVDRVATEYVALSLWRWTRADCWRCAVASMAVCLGWDAEVRVPAPMGPGLLPLPRDSLGMGWDIYTSPLIIIAMGRRAGDGG